MPTLHLVRHGQASFGADDYDHLSDLGARQCRLLGQWMHERGLRFEAVLTGTLRRHRQSLQALAESLPGLPEATVWSALDEYDSHALLRALPGEPLPPPDTEAGRRAHFRRLREALQAWMAGRIRPEGMPAWSAFRSGVVEVLAHIGRTHGGDVLVVSSGGPIATAVAHVMQAPDAMAIELNLRMRNSALTEFAFSARGQVLHSFNTLPHLDAPEHRGSISYA
jgi:broad specificity phosphatase PhoE